MPRRPRFRGAQGLLGELEYEIMQVLWSTGPANVGTVLDQLNRRRRRSAQLAYTTAMTVLARLYDKELLDRTKIGRGYTYVARFTEQELVEHLGQLEVEDLVHRYGQVALAQFAAALRDADPELLDRAREVAEQHGG